jgi:hypothetical protein
MIRHTKLTRKERREQKNVCINKMMKEYLETNPVKAVSSAYSECVVGIKKMIKQHLIEVFRENNDPVDLLFNFKADEKTLWDLRNFIAHGNVESLSEEQQELIDLRAWDVERLARDYIIKIINLISGENFPEEEIQISTTSMFEECIFSNENMYHGTDNMAEIYSSKYEGWISG